MWTYRWYFRYEASDLYKPFNPSSRAARYQARGAVEEQAEFPAPDLGDTSSQGTGEGSSEGRRGDDDEERTERPKKPIDEVRAINTPSGLMVLSHLWTIARTFICNRKKYVHNTLLNFSKYQVWMP